jgi:ribosomal protein S18 acetylase RimI-like enzyme
MADVIIRPYDPETDYPPLAANLQEANLYDGDRDTEERLRQFAGSVLVAEAEGKVVGSIYVVNHIVPTIFRLVVNEANRRQGIGIALMEAGLQKLLDEGAKDVELFFEAENATLAAWYKARGFQDGGLYRSMWRYTDI